jgi:hypothetical protein
MKEITIKQKVVGTGFSKSTEKTFEGAEFENGRIAYLNSDEAGMCMADSEKRIGKRLKV